MQYKQQPPEPAYLDQTLGQLVEKGIEVAQRTGEFAMDQAPELLKEFYMWHTAMAIFWIVICTTLSLIVFIYCFTSAKSSDEPGTWKFFGLGLSLMILIGTAFNVYNLIYITVAPRLYLIDYYLK